MTQVFKEAKKAGDDWMSPNTRSSTEALDKAENMHSSAYSLGNPLLHTNPRALGPVQESVTTCGR